MIFIPMALAIFTFGFTALLDNYSEKRGELEHYAETFYDEVGFEPAHKLIRLEYSTYDPQRGFCEETLDYLFFWDQCSNPNVIGVCTRVGPWAVIEISDVNGALYDRQGNLVLKTEQLLLHELGHLYGLKHTEDKGGPSLSLIMTSSSFPIRDRAQLERERRRLIWYIQQKHGMITIQ